MTAFNNTYQKIKKYEWGKLFFELIVVFLGVSAGFLLNNWRMEQEEIKLEEKYLKSFLQDIKLDIPELEKAVETDSLWLALAKPILTSIVNKNISLDSARIMIKMILKISKLNANKSTFEEISNSGNLNILTDFELKSQIVKYYLDLGGVEFIDDYFNKYGSLICMKCISKHKVAATA